MTTPDAIRDLVKRLLRIADGYEPTDYGIAVNLREAAAALKQLLEAVEEAERVMLDLTKNAPEEEPPSYADEWGYISDNYDDVASAAMDIVRWRHAELGRAWRAKHGASR